MEAMQTIVIAAIRDRPVDIGDENIRIFINMYRLQAHFFLPAAPDHAERLQPVQSITCGMLGSAVAAFELLIFLRAQTEAFFLIPDPAQNHILPFTYEYIIL